MVGRRSFLKTVGLGVVAAVTGWSPFGCSLDKRKPNILIILADDMGFSDIGCYGGEIHTPNLDYLAANGLRFTQFYNAARCSPTRASILTGLYPHQAGMGFGPDFLKYPGYQGKLSDNCVTIAELLKRGGYSTYMSGKWHLGNHRPNWPVDRGFDRYFGLIDGACSYWELLPGLTMALDDNPWKPDPEDKKFYMTDAFTNFALSCLDNHNKNQPFFLYLAYTAPHWPLHAWPEDIAKYRGKYQIGWDELRKQRHKRMINMGIVQDKWPLSPRHPNVPPWDEVGNKDEQDLRMAVYAAMIDRMDQNIGQVIDKLKEIGEFENTVILFLSDNGACHVMVNRGEPGIPPGPKGGFWGYSINWANAGNTPLRLFKQNAHEGGISTPLIVHWPDGVQNKNSITHQPGHIIDILPTCLDIAGLEYPKNLEGKEILPLQGLSLLPIIQGKKRKAHGLLLWEHTGNRAIREGNLKLVSTRNGKWELYDLEKDRTELNDLSSIHPEKVLELLEKYTHWAEQNGVEPWSVINEIRRKKNQL